MTEEQQLEQLREMLMRGLGLTEDDIRVIKARTDEQEMAMIKKAFAHEMPTIPDTYIWPEGVKQL